MTHIIEPDMPVFPGTQPPVFQKANTFEKDNFRETKITMYSHTGTHMDAPAHMLSNGAYLDDLGIGKFVGNAIVLDFEDNKQQVIGLDSIKHFEDIIRKVEFIVIKTGWSKYWGTSRYFEDFPYLSDEAAKWLSEFNLKGIGLDAISIDGIKSTTFAVHKILLKKNILIIENLTNLDLINRGIFILSVLPLKSKEADGAPVRAVGIENVLDNN